MHTSRHDTRVSSAVVLAMIAMLIPALITPSSAGPIDPPGGTIAPTGPNLIFPENLDTFPITIDTPGQYKLMGDVRFNGLAGSGSIVIDASDVTLDLNGFAIIQAGVTLGNGISFPASGSVERVVIRNGEIRDCNFGVIGDEDVLSQLVVENVGFHRIRAAAITAGDDAIVRDCEFYDTASFFSAIRVRDHAIIERCTIVDANQGAILVRRGCVVRDNVIRDSNLGIEGSDNAGANAYNRILDNTINNVVRGIDFGADNPLQLIYNNVVTDASNDAIDAASSDQPQASDSTNALPLSNFVE